MSGLLPFGSAPYNQSKDTIHVLKAGDTMSGTLYSEVTGIAQEWLDGGGNFYAQAISNSANVFSGRAAFIFPQNRFAGNLYLGQTEIGEGGITYNWDASVVGSAYTQVNFIQTLRPDYLTSGVVTS